MAPTSRHWTWVPSEAHIDTDRLCSAGSRDDPVPRRHRSYAALRLPVSIGYPSGSPCGSLPRGGRLFCASTGRRHVRPANVSCVGDGSPALRKTGISSRRGEGLLCCRCCQAPFCIFFPCLLWAQCHLTHVLPLLRVQTRSIPIDLFPRLR
jgi:hypothetical protein